jgi:hypothetical protein
MEHALVLTNDAAIHPVRRGFPPPALIPLRPSRKDDIRFFAMSYVAGFFAVYLLIA